MAVAGKNNHYPPFRLVIFALILAMILGMITVQLRKDDIAVNLTQEVNKALVFTGLPLVSVSFDGRDGFVSGILTDESQSEQVVDTISQVNGVRKVNNQLQITATEVVAVEESIIADMDDVEFENGLYVATQNHPLEKYKLDKVKFAYGQLMPLEEGLPVLDRLAKILQQNSQIQLEVSVHTDNQGTAIGQIASTQSRAENIRHYLIEKGVKPEQLLAKGYGAGRPVATNDTAAGQEENRRVEIRVLKDR